MTRRSVGVTLLAWLIAAGSVGAAGMVLSSPGARRHDRLLIATSVLVILGLVAAQALGRLRPYAFAAFTLWSVAAVALLVLWRIGSGSTGSLIRLLEPILYAGLAYAALAYYLRRAV